MNSLRMLVPPDQKPSTIITGNSLEFIRACEAEQSVRGEGKYLCSYFPTVSFRKVVPRRHGMFLLFAKHTCQTGSRMKQDLELHLMVQ